jgi:hypothetical protein
MSLATDTQYVDDVLEGTSQYVGDIPLSTLTTQDYVSSDITDLDLTNLNITVDELSVLDRSQLIQLLTDYEIAYDANSSDAELITLILANLTMPMRRSIFYLLPYESISYFPNYYPSYYPSFYPGYPVGIKPYLWMRKRYGQRYYPGIYSIYHPYYYYRRGINPYSIARTRGFYFDPTRRIKGGRNVRGHRFISPGPLESKEFIRHIDRIPQGQRDSVTKFLSRRQSFATAPRIETKRPLSISSPRTDIRPILTKTSRAIRPPISPRSIYVPGRTMRMSSSIPRIVSRPSRVTFQTSSPRSVSTPRSSPRSSPRTLSPGRMGRSGKR